jgi:dihydroflavonol-4-reductase
MKAFVTGANGFIGSHLVPILIKRGYSVTCLVRDPAKASRLAGMGAALAPGDITDRACLPDPMRGSEVVFHLAGWYAIGIRDKARMQAINVDGARNVMETAAELGVPKIVHTSTVGVFGNTRGKIVDETYRIEKEEMASEYERTKWAAHYEVGVPLQKKGAPIIMVQPGGVMGIGDTSPLGMLFTFFLQRMPVLPGERSGATFAHVDDIAEGHVLAAEKGRPGESYVLAGPALTYRQFMEKCEALTGIPAPKIWMPGWLTQLMALAVRPLEMLGMELQFSSEGLSTLADYTFWATAEKARRELGWTPRPVDDALKEVLDHEMAKMKK